MSIHWAPVTEQAVPSGNRMTAGWQGEGAEFSYLTGMKTSGSGHFLCRWRRGVHRMDEMMEACRTVIDVGSEAQGRRIAEAFEDGQDTPGQPVWTRSRPSVPVVTGDSLARHREALRRAGVATGSLLDPPPWHRDAPPPHPELGPGTGHQPDGPADCPRCQLLRENAGWLNLAPGQSAVPLSDGVVVFEDLDPEEG